MIGTGRGGSELDAYRSVESAGARPEDFMKMGLDAARIALLRAEAAMRAGERPEKARALASAGNVVEFLLGIAGIEPGDLSDRLCAVYRFALAAILKGNAVDDSEAVAAARVALEELAAVWRNLYPDAGAAEAVTTTGSAINA